MKLREVAYKILNRPVSLPLYDRGIWLVGWKPIKLLHEHEPETSALMRRFVTKDMVVADVGANVGYFTVLMSRLAKKVIAYEPDATSYRRLRWALAANAVSNAQARQAAVGASVGRADLFGKPGSGLNSISYKLGEKVSSVDVEQLAEVDFAKIDAEGAELEVLRGMRRRIPCVVEFAPKNLERLKTPPEAFLEEIRRLGYLIQEIHLDGTTSPLHSIPSSSGHVNLFLVPST